MELTTQTPNTSLAKTQSTSLVKKKPRNDAELHQTAQKFEAMFMTQMLNHMYEGVKTDGPFGGGNGEKVFRSMMLQEYGKIMATNDSTGLADHIYTQLLQLQEGAQ